MPIQCLGGGRFAIAGLALISPGPYDNIGFVFKNGQMAQLRLRAQSVIMVDGFAAAVATATFVHTFNIDHESVVGGQFGSFYLDAG
jgi:hypothetical protein